MSKQKEPELRPIPLDEIGREMEGKTIAAVRAALCDAPELRPGEARNRLIITVRDQKGNLQHVYIDAIPIYYDDCDDPVAELDAYIADGVAEI